VSAFFQSVIDADGMTTVPPEICSRLGFRPGMAVEWLKRDASVIVRVVPDESSASAGKSNPLTAEE
jgi:bifunctional DNA-binding transcriptional regulator/antitoxin component of YhaV-PrlF toxin-antitoxin module